MNNTEIINNKIKRKIDSKTSIVELYNCPIFTEFYDQLTMSNNFYDDLGFYKKVSSKEERIIELASGTGRILIPMLKEKYNIIGVEKEKEMIEKMPYQYREYVICEDILDSNKLKEYYEKADVFILPATSISLFSLKDIRCFINNIISINNKFKFIFDVANIEDLITTQPQKYITDKGTFYDSNHVINDCISYNVFHKESNTLGYSLKFNHKTQVIKEMLSKLNMQISEIKYPNSYCMFVCEYNSN